MKILIYYYFSQQVFEVYFPRREITNFFHHFTDGDEDDDKRSVQSYGSVGRGGDNGRINVPRTYSDDIRT